MIEWAWNHAVVIAGAGVPLALAALGAFAGRRWMREPLILRRWHALTVVYVLAMLGSAGLIAGVVANDKATRARADLRAELRHRIETETRDKLTQAEVDRRIRRLERPRSTDLLREIRRAGAICRRHPRACARAARSFGAAASQPPAIGRAQLERDATRPGDRRDASRPSTGTTRRPGPTRRRDPSPGPNGQNAPAPPASSPSRPPVEIHPPPLPAPLPKLPPLCTGLVDVGCDTFGRP